MTNSSFGKVAVIFGGTSAEREISLISGNAVLQALVQQKVNAIKFDPRENSFNQLIEENFDRAFIMLHGRGGEDGTIQGALDFLGVPYTGSDVLGSSLAMDKYRTKLVWKSIGIPTPPFKIIKSRIDLLTIADEIGFPIALKPLREGSTLGLTKVSGEKDLFEAYKKALAYDEYVIAEKWISGVEVTASVLHEEILPLVRINAPGGNYDYEAKYFSEDTKYICPADLGLDMERHVKALSIKAFKELGCSGWGRVDVMIDSDNSPWFLEVNTIPGMTPHSLFPMAAFEAGFDFNALALKILECTNVE